MAQKEIFIFSSAENESIHLVRIDSKMTAEADILQNFKCGDEKAFTRIYHTYFDILYNYVRQFDLYKEFVKDQFRELFIHIQKNRKHLAYLKAIRIYPFKSMRRGLLSGRK